MLDAFKNAVLAAKSIRYISIRRAAGRAAFISPGFWERLGIADQVRPKQQLTQGGHVADIFFR